VIELKNDSEKEPTKNSIFSTIPMLKSQNTEEELEFVMEDESKTNHINHGTKEEKPVNNFI